MTADYVLLHTLECINLAEDSSLIEHLRSFLEGCCRHEALSTEGCTGNTLKHLLTSSRLCIACIIKFLVTTLEHRVLVAQTAWRNNHTRLELGRVARLGDDLHTPDAIVLGCKLELIDNLVLKEVGVA